MPLDEQASGRSHIDLIERTGYLQRRAEVTVDALYAHLATDPDLVEAWQGWVDDNRSSPAWYFATRGPGQFELAHVGRRGEIIESHMFDDRARACAEYIHRDIEDLAEIDVLWHRPWRLLPKIVGWFREGRRG